MFKKLRNRILLMNMVVLTALLVVVLSLSYVMAGANAQTENRVLLRLEQKQTHFAHRVALYEIEEATSDGIAVSFVILPMHGLTGRTITGKMLIVEDDYRGPNLSLVEDQSSTLDAPALFNACTNYLTQIIMQVSPGGRGYVLFEDGGLPEPVIPSALLTELREMISDDTVTTVRVPPELYTSYWAADFGVVYPADVYQAGVDQFLKSKSLLGTFKLNGQSWLYAVDLTLPSIKDQDLPEREQIKIAISYQLTIVDITESTKSLETTRLILIGVGLVLFCLFFVVSSQIAKRVVRPVEASWLRQQQFMSDASHELKTPLSIISANQEVLRENRSQSIESQMQWLDVIEAETGRMGRLVASLLDLSKGEETPPELCPVDISQLVEEVCTGFDALAFEKEVELTREIKPDLIVMAEAESLRAALVALFDNAVIYTPAGEQIRASLYQERKQVVFTLRNTGVCIAPEDLAHLFDRFYRVDQARTSETGGFGLGLSIAQNAVERSGGIIEAVSDKDSVTFSVRLKTH